VCTSRNGIKMGHEELEGGGMNAEGFLWGLGKRNREGRKIHERVGKTGLGEGKQGRVREERGKKKPRRQGNKQAGKAVGNKGKGEKM
jgi:hypothetical protein